MNNSDIPGFDRYADQYTHLHRASIKASGEEPAYFSRYKARYMAARLGNERAGRPIDLLDFGCGIGNSIPYLREAFPRARLHGVDPSGESIQLAQSMHAGTAEFQVNERDRLQYGKRSFDLVHVACVFHHIHPEQRQHWMREIRRVLKPGGEVFLFEHNVLNPLTVKAVRDCPFDEDAILLRRRESLDLAHAAGFTAVRARYIVFFPAALSFLRPFEPWFGFVPYGAQYVVRGTA
ncbi:MAG: class I SAM-dependent methyltransferase [Rhodanobacteraceae bacterium]